MRDGLLHGTPKDFDIATSALPKEVLGLFESADAIGANFGVILVRMGGFSFEVATFRHDGSYKDGRHPEQVTFSTPQEDALRRDFTINGLFSHPLTGEIIDYVGGVRDLKKGVVRCIGLPEERFREDALRLLRGVRFASRLGFSLEEKTAQALGQYAYLLKKISAERIRDEWSHILLQPHRLQGFDLLESTGLLWQFLPEIRDLHGCQQPVQWHPEGDVFVHTRLMLSRLCDESSLQLVLAVLLHDIGKPATYSYDERAERIRFNGHDILGAEMASEILERLRYPKKIIEAVHCMVKRHMRFSHVMDMRTARLKRFMSSAYFEDEMRLHYLDCACSNGLLDNYFFLKEKQEEFAKEPLIPPPLLRGKDLIDKGLEPSPLFKEILFKAQSLQLEGQLTSHEEAIVWLNDWIAKEG